MNTSEMTKPPQTSLWQDFVALLRYRARAAWTRIGSRRVLILLGIAVVAGVAFNWSWLTAIGVTPILVALAPCAAMCALGLCMNKVGGKSCSTGQQADKGSHDPAAQKTELDPT